MWDTVGRLAGLTLIAAVVVTPPLASDTAAAAGAGLPAGLAWVARPPGANSATLYRVSATGQIVRRALDRAVNAIGCTSDGTVYGLSNRRPGGPHVVRIDRGGTVTDLGSVATPDGADRYPVAAGYAGTLQSGDSGHTLLVAAGRHLREIRIGAASAVLAGSRALPALPPIGDWTLVADGSLITVVATGDAAELIRLDPSTLRSRTTRLPRLPGGSAYGGVALAPDGSIYALHNQVNRHSAVYRIPPGRPGSAVRIAEIDRAESSDAAFCAEPAAATAIVAPLAPPVAAQASPAAPPVVPTPPPVSPPAPRAAPTGGVAPPPSPSHDRPPPVTAKPVAAVPKMPVTDTAEPSKMISPRLIPIVAVAGLAAVLTRRLARCSRCR